MSSKSRIQRKKAKIKLSSENFKIKPPKQCPWCPVKSYAHKFENYHGLLRHVRKEHLYTKKREAIEWANGFIDVAFVRVFKVRYSEYDDYAVQGIDHVDAMIYSYCLGKYNPSLRDPMEKA